MAARISVLVFFCSLLLSTTSLRGQEPAKGEGRKVVASATATTYVEPDGARLIFYVTTTESVDKSAREANDKQIKKVRDALAAIPMDKRHMEIRVLPTSISGLASSAEAAGGSRQLTGKRVQSAFQIAVYEQDVAKLRNVVCRLGETVTENGGAGIEPDSPFRAIRAGRGIVRDEPESVPGPSIEWLNTAPAQARREAIRRATAEAMANAGAAAGVDKLSVLEIHVTSHDEPNSYSRLRGDPGAKGSILIPIRVVVQVTCTY
jgi:uncharacterized protein YggE